MEWSRWHTMAAACAALAAAAWYLSQPGGGTSEAPPARARLGAPHDATSPTGQGGMGADARGPQSTDESPAADPFLAADLRHRFEEMIQEALSGGAASTPDEMKARVMALVGRHFPPEHGARAAALVGRYIDYRAALAGVAPPADPSDPRALRDALEKRLQIQLRHFSGEEFEALFAKEAELDRFTLARLEIQRNASLSAAQKEAALRSAEQELGAADRAQRAGALQHLEAAAQTAALDRRNASDTVRFAEREAAYGRAAAVELEKMDREDRDWQARLGEFAQAQARLAPQELRQVQDRLFTPQEQLRLDAALAMRDASARR